MPCSHASASASPRTGSSRSGSSPEHTYGASLADVAQRLDAEELFGQVMGLFELADGRGVAPFAVRVFNPTLAGDGYATVGSVVETNSEDMSFLVDSVSEELGARGLEIRLVVHPVIGVERDSEGGIAQVRHAREAEVRESVMHFEVGRHLPAEQLPELEARIRVVLMDVQAAVRDFKAMTDRVPELVEAARASTARYARDEIEETELFLWWLLDGNYVFLGARDYVLEGGMLSVAPGRGLGIMAGTRDPPTRARCARRRSTPASANGWWRATCSSSRRRTGSRPSTGA